MSPIWYWVSPILSDLLRFGPIWSDLVIRVTAYISVIGSALKKQKQWAIIKSVNVKIAWECEKEARAFFI